MLLPPPMSTLFPYTTLFRSDSTTETGKMLDFLLQELNREANTTLSKSTELSIKEAALGIKAEVEKLREQVRSEEHTSELQSPCNLVCRLLLENKYTT